MITNPMGAGKGAMSTCVEVAHPSSLYLKLNLVLLGVL